MQVQAESLYSRHSHTHKLSAALLRAAHNQGSRIAQDILGCLSTSDYKSIVDMECDPRLYTDADQFRLDYCAYSLLRKYPHFPLGIDKRKAAIDKFLETEVACGLTNQTNVRPYVIREIGLTPEAYIMCAREKIRTLLGEFCWDAAAEHFAFTSGASTRLRRKTGAPFYKFQGKPETTRNNALLASAAVKSIPIWHQSMVSRYGSEPSNWFTIVDGSKVTTVAKTAKVDRCIAIEPEMNMFIQTGIGKVIRQKLKSVRIDLHDQTLNQKLAKIGSGTGSLVTIDLASASDSVSLALVELLLPPAWYKAMCLCRSEYGILPNGLKHRFEKISSMGNGYTFELESLIFWALSKAVLDLRDVSDRRLGIYGDDIVIHNSAADDLIVLLDYCGFRTNSEKTFLSGPFRESCGKHYFYGEDVSPFYIKEPLETLERQFWFVNSLRLWTSQMCSSDAFQKVYTYGISVIPYRHRYFVPMSLGAEAGIWASLDECRPSFSKWRQAFSLRVLVSRRAKHKPDGDPALLSWLMYNRARQNEGTSTEITLEKGKTNYRHSRRYMSWWDSAPCGVTIRPALQV